MHLALLKFKLLGNLPFIGKRVERDYYKELSAHIVKFEKQYNKPTVKFDQLIHDLYDCLAAAPIAICEDFDWFLTLAITAHTKTSGSALEFLHELEDRTAFPFDPYFKEFHVSSKETDFLAWYSNRETTMAFIWRFLQVLQLYCLENPLDENEGVAFSEHRKAITKPMLEFFNGSYFRLVLDDFITIVQLAIDSQLRRLNDKEK